MPKHRIVVLCVAALVAQPCAAQARTAATEPHAAFNTFLTVAAFTGQPASALAPHWPRDLPRSGDAELLLTAAHRLSVSVEQGRRATDSAVVRAVTLLEYVADTIALRQRITDVMQQLQTKYGAPDQCSTPFGPPSYLFTAQTVDRVWSKGIASLQTRFGWWRTPDAKLGITIIVSNTPVDDATLLPCAARMP